MTKEIPLTQGKVALIDDEDYERLSQWKWHAHRQGNTFYAARQSPLVNGSRHIVFMHREIMGTPDGGYVDHWNWNGLDNRRENLRVCTNSQNQRNRGKPRNNTSGYKGVSWHKGRGKWYAMIKLDGKIINLGSHNSVLEAARAYDAAAIELHGEFACLNFQ